MTWLVVGWLACQGFDGVSSAIALHRPGFQEGNPVLRGWRGPTLKIGVNVGALVWYRQAPHRAVPLLMMTAGCVAGGVNTWRIAHDDAGAADQ